MPAPYSAGSIFLQVVPSFRGVPEQIAREARDWGDQAGKNYDEAFEKHATDSAKRAGDKAGKELEDSGSKAGDKAGKAYAGRFETAVKQAVQRAAREVGTIKVDADDTAAKRKVATLKTALADLGKAKIGVNINAADAFAKLTAIEEGLREVQDRATTIDARVNAAGALGSITKIRTELMALSAIQIEPEIKIDRQLGIFERGLKGAIDSALKDLGTVNVGVGSSAGERAIADLREKLFELSDRKIGIDISAETARERLNQILDELQRITGEHWNIDLDANTAGAAANLEAFLALLDRVDGKHVEVDVDTKGTAGSVAGLAAVEGQADRTRNAARSLNSTMGQDGANSFRAFNARVLGVAALGPLVIPAIGGIAGAIGGLAPLAVAGAAGLGVLALGLYGVVTAFKAMTAVEASQGTDMTTYLKGVETASRQVRDAQEGLAAAHEAAAQAAEDSADRVKQAQRGVADAEAQAADRTAQAARQVRSAEQQLADAQRAAQKAQEDLTQARKDAAQQLEDLQLQVRGNALDQRQATLDLHQAKADLDAGIAKGLKGDDLEALQVAYERAQLRIDQVKETQQQLNDEQQKWAKTGVEGSDQVVAAQERVQQTQRGVADSQQALADANAAQAKTAQENARAVGDAQVALASAQRDAARQQENSSQAVAKAQQQVNDALDNYSDALTKTSAAQTKLDQAMQNMSPTGRAFVTWLDSLRPRFRELQGIAQDGFLPGLAAWIDSIVNRGPQIERVIGSISQGFGDMFARFGTSLNGAAFSQLFDMIDRAGPRFIAYMGSTLINLGEGVASLVSALEPLGDIVGVWMIQMSRAFKDWASSLSGTKGLQDFFDYVQRIGPKIADFFSALWQAVLNLGKAMAPFAEGLLDKLTAGLQWIADMDPARLRAIATGIVGITLALQAIFGLTALAKSFQSAMNIVFGPQGVLTRMGGSEAALGVAAGKVGMFAASFSVLYTQSSLVRDVVNDTIGALVDFGKKILDFIPDLKTVASVIATIAASWKVFQLIGQGLGNLSGKLVNAAPAFGQMVGDLFNSEAAGTRAAGALGKFGKVLGAVGGALPIVGIGVGLIAAGMEAASQKTQAEIRQLTGWISATREGGEKAVEAAANLKKYKDALAESEQKLRDQIQAQKDAGPYQRSIGAAINDTKNKIEDQTDKLKKAQKQWDDYWKSLSPIEQAQYTLQAAQNDLSYAVEHYGRTSKEAKTAADNYAAAQNALQSIQYDVAAATSGLNQQLQDQLQLMMSLADAELGYDQAVSNLDDAHKNAADALAQYGANSKEYRNALLQEEQQMSSTAQAAQRVAEQRYQNTDATTKQAMGEAAYYLELQRQKDIYGELPPRLEAIRANLEKSIDPTVLAAAKFYDLGVKIQAVPDSKTIILDSSTTDDAIQKMTDLGLHVERLPDGTVKVAADTEEAQKIIDDILKPKTLDVTVAVHDGINHDAVQRSIDLYGRENINDPRGGRIGRAGGGPVWGLGTATSDSIPAWLSNGEYVIRAQSVSKYGLDLLDAINQGHYAAGGPVRRKHGLPAFQDGGMVANWGGTISLSGGNPNPLAGLWFDALNQIANLSAQAASVISNSFSALRDNAMGTFSQLTTGVTGQWVPFLGNLITTGGQARDGLNTTWAQLRDLILGRTTETRDGANGLFGQLRDWLFGRTTETRDGVGGLLSQLRENAVTVLTDAVIRMTNMWGTLPGWLINPVNTIIDKVLNNGLFKAFNAIVSALGLDAKLNIPTVSPAKLAAGGKVPGYSPHDRADNIPAMLTAGEFVQPVDAVDYYGPEFMDLLRKRKIPREMLGLRGYATGGYVAMENVLHNQFPWIRFTSDYRPGDPGYHGKGMAVDSAGVRPYPDPSGVAQMLEINRWIASHFSNITELIHTGAGAINLWHGQPHTYNAATQAEHRNHVHWAMADGLTPGSSILGDLAKLLGVGEDLIGDPAGFLRQVVDNALGGFDSDGVPVKRIMADGVRKMTGFVVDKVTGFLSSVFGFGDDGFADVSGGTVAQETQQVFSRYGWGGGQQWDDASWVISHESGWNPRAQNPSSSASGLGQMIDGTWRAYRPAAAAGYAHMKDAPVSMQADATARYMGQRYGSPSGAKSFWVGHHYYGSGGPVQDADSATGGIVPDLHDTGGWIMPGLNVIMNRTGRPEPTINPQTLDALQAIAGRGDGHDWPPIVVPVMNGPTAKEIVGEVNHARTVASRGGKHP